MNQIHYNVCLLEEKRVGQAGLEIAQLAEYMTGCLEGKAVITEDDIRTDIAKGCPVEADKTVNPLKYAAWLLVQNGMGG